jgi:hypothetical protein
MPASFPRHNSTDEDDGADQGDDESPQGTEQARRAEHHQKTAQVEGMSDEGVHPVDMTCCFLSSWILTRVDMKVFSIVVRTIR